MCVNGSENILPAAFTEGEIFTLHYTSETLSSKITMSLSARALCGSVIDPESIMKNFFRSMKDYAVAFPKVLLFELSYKLILIAIGAPIIMVLLRITAKVSGVGYVSDESLLVYLHDPLTLIVFIIVLFCVGFFTFVELSSLAACFSFYSLHQRISVGDMLRIGLKCFAKAFRSSGIL